MHHKDRVVSIDILRGLTILVMVFVNDVASVKNLPWWTYHMPRGVNGLTYVDVVFPAFLFIVGMSIPLAFQKRLAQQGSLLKLLSHVFFRSISLVVIGILIMNGRDMDPGATGISYALWNVLMFTGVILFWNAYPKNSDKQTVFRLLKGSGLVLLIILLFIYKRNVDGDYRWLNIYNWSILGAIGWAYLSTCLIYAAFRNKPVLIAVAFLVLCLMNITEESGLITIFRKIPPIIWPFRNGSLSSITVAGLMLSLVFTQDIGGAALSKKMSLASGFVLFLFVSGVLLLPLGLAKIGSTPSWCLLSLGIMTLLFLAVYWMVDIKNIQGWAGLIRPAGSNPLLTYLLPDIFYAIFGLYYLDSIMGSGLPGVIRSLLFTFLILGVSAVMTRAKVRLQL